MGANIAEGCGRKSDGEMARFLHIARGSAVELEYHLLLARDLGILPGANFSVLERQVDEIQRMLTSLIQRVQGDHYSGRAGVVKALEVSS